MLGTAVTLQLYTVCFLKHLPYSFSVGFLYLKNKVEAWFKMSNKGGLRFSGMVM
jgi:hypothetical protein